VLDHRTDVYSLGLTLYELLTLEPAFPGDDRQHLIRRITEDDPRPPRQLNKSIPRDLETIILKATAKEPQSRYATAQQLADDLRRYLEDQPIRARRPTPIERAAKWSRRHRTAVTATVAATIVVLLAGAGLLWYGQHREATQRQRAEKNLQLALQVMDEVYMEFAWENALSLRGCSQQEKLTEPAERVLRKAMQFYEQFAESNRGDSSVVIETAKAYKSTGDIREMLGMHEKATDAWAQAESAVLPILRTRARQQPERLAQAYVVLGEVSAARGDNAGAIQYLSQAIALDPEDCDALSTRAHRYVNSGMPDEAIADATEVIRLGTSCPPKDPVTIPAAYNVRGQAYREKGEYDRAIAEYNRSMSLLLDGRARDRSTLYSNRGQLYRKKGELDRAIADLDEAIRLFPQNSDAYTSRGTVYDEKGEFDRALADHDEAIRFSPNDASLYHNRACCYGSAGEFDRAIADFSRAIEMDWGEYHFYRSRAYQARGSTYYRKDQLDRAIADYDRAIGLDAKDPLYYVCRARARARLGHLQDALSDVAKALEINPTPDGTRHLAWLLANCEEPRLRRVDRALELAKAALKQAPKYAVIWTTLGAAEYRAGHWQAAVDALQKSSELKYYNVGRTGFFRAMAHWQLGQKDEARQWYDKAVEWMEKNRPWDEELRRFRAEAEELMGMAETHHGDTEGTEKK
jgi:tetratricopeptide (TPR) repeat protein